jgi:hypothetical protein
MTDLTPYQQLAEVRSVTGQQVHLRAFDEVLEVRVDREKLTAMVRLLRYTVVERKMEDVLTRCYEQIIGINGATGERLTYSVEVEDFRTTRVRRFTTRTEHESQARRFWEASCGTPGQSRFGAPIQAEREREYFASPTSTRES